MQRYSAPRGSVRGKPGASASLTWRSPEIGGVSTVRLDFLLPNCTVGLSTDHAAHNPESLSSVENVQASAGGGVRARITRAVAAAQTAIRRLGGPLQLHAASMQLEGGRNLGVGGPLTNANQRKPRPTKSKHQRPSSKLRIIPTINH